MTPAQALAAKPRSKEPKPNASRLRRLRLKAGLTIERVADAVGLSYVTLHHYEVGRRSPNARTALAIARFYGVTVEAIWG
jgi:DNA-binding XRE family transcriptional regulator